MGVDEGVVYRWNGAGKGTRNAMEKFGFIEEFDLPSVKSYADKQQELPPQGEVLVKVVEFGEWTDDQFAKYPNADGSVPQTLRVVYQIEDDGPHQGYKLSRFVRDWEYQPEPGEVSEGEIYHVNDKDGVLRARLHIVPPPGFYELKVVEISPLLPNERNPKLPQRIFTYEIQGGEYSGHRIREYYTWSNAEVSKLNPVVSALLGGEQDPDARYKPSDFIGRSMQATVIHKKASNGIPWPKIGANPVPIQKPKRGKKTEASPSNPPF